jgi:MYXO-CTERM domain-containing protein
MGSPLQRDEEAPYGWSVANVPASTFMLHVVATDLAGNTAMSNVVEIIVADEPPEIDGTEGDTDSGGEDSEDEGCGCRTAPPAPAALSLLLLVALGRRRRQPSVHT